MFRQLALGLLGRKLLRELTALRQATEAQNSHLARLAHHFAPADPDGPPSADTGLSFLDANDATLAEGWAVRFQTTHGRYPTDDEVTEYLDDEKTRDLATRLQARAATAERITREREEAFR